MAAGTVKPLIVIVGPTASGKTSLAIRLAQRYNGEIICADSRTAYKEMNIGTAKPTAEEQAMIPHWGLDLVEPGDRFSAADFKKYALQKIDEVRRRGKIPFLVGGTGLYVDAILFDYEFAPPSSEGQKFEHFDMEELRNYCVKNNIKLPENEKNKRYLLRAIERKGVQPKRREQPISDSIIVGISTDKTILRKRIEERLEQMFNNNVVKEATLLGEKYGWNSEALTGNIYPLIRQYLTGKHSLNEIKEKAITADWRLAKRQLTWLKRNPFIVWRDLKGVEQYLEDQLANK